MADSHIIPANEAAREVCKALGIDPNRVRRVVLDLCADEPITAYVEMYGDTRFLEIKWELSGAKVEFSPGDYRNIEE